MNRSITLMLTTSGKRNVHQVVLSPLAVWFGGAVLLLVLGGGVWGLSSVYRTYSSSRQIKSEYETLMLDHSRLVTSYKELENRLRKIEQIESSVRHVLGLPETTPAGGGDESDEIGQGGTEFDWHGLALDEASQATGIAVTKETANMETIPLSSDTYERADNLIKRLEQIQTATDASVADMGVMPTITPIADGEPYWLSSQFGVRHSPFTSKMEFHGGVDISARSGTPIVAAADGVISEMINYNVQGGALGNAIKIKHGDYTTIYGHMNSANPFAKGIQVGTHVRRNQVIGYVGSTGRSTSPHLHYEVWYKGVRVNPVRFLLDR